MATVYLAEDLKHHRKVAVKILRPDLAASLGPERFLREVTIAAGLTHPHILPLHDSGEVDGVLFYVMPYVEGTSLRQRLLREGELPIAMAVRILRDVADAMAHAHQHGVVHRDIKPENVMLTDRHALVADFGVAKAVSAATGANHLTTAGVALGTPAYMAPEQATADPHTDHRADIYAWGVMAYELLTGQPPFTGTTPQAVLAAHVMTVPEPVTKSRAAVPAALASLVMRALEKKPADRWQSANDLIGPLESVLGPSEAVTPVETPPLAPQGKRERLRVGAGNKGWLLAAAVVTSVFAGGVLLGSRTGDTPSRQRAPDGSFRFFIDTRSSQFDATLGQLPRFAVAPGGRALVFGEGDLLHFRDLGSFVARPLEGTEGATAPAFSPDGEWLVFSQGGRIRKMAVEGGQVIDVATSNFRLGAFWSSDNFIYYSAGLGDRGIWRVPASGGQSEPVTQLSDSVREQAHGWPQVLPNGQDLLYTVLGPSGGAEGSRIVVETIGSGDQRTLVEGAAFARYLSTGHIVYADVTGALLAVTYDAKARRVLGTPVPVLDQRVATAVWGGRAAFEASNEGLLVWLPDTGYGDHLLIAVDRLGRGATPISEPANMRGAVVGPDGRSVALTVREPGRNDIWLFSTSSDQKERLTLDLAEDEMPVWGPGDRMVTYRSAWAGQTSRIMVTDVIARAAPEVMRTWSRHIHPTDWSPDRKWLAAYDYHPTNNEDIWVLGVESADSLSVAASAAAELNPVFSPDGRWLAYQSSESGRQEIYVVAFPSLAGRRQVSNGGGISPRWDPKGTTLYFLQGRRMMAIPVVTGKEFRVTAQAQLLFETAQPPYEFDLGADGRFLLLLPNALRTAAPIHVVLNWLPELAAIGPSGPSR